jgi:hypothetical protein
MQSQRREMLLEIVRERERERERELSLLGTLEFFTSVFHFGKETFSIDLFNMNISVKENI